MSMRNSHKSSQGRSRSLIFGHVTKLPPPQAGRIAK